MECLCVNVISRVRYTISENHETHSFTCIVLNSTHIIGYTFMQNDLACNYVGGRALADTISWEGAGAFRDKKMEPVMIAGAEMAQTKSTGPLTFFQVTKPCVHIWSGDSLVKNLAYGHVHIDIHVQIYIISCVYCDEWICRSRAQVIWFL